MGFFLRLQYLEWPLGIIIALPFCQSNIQLFSDTEVKQLLIACE